MQEKLSRYPLFSTLEEAPYPNPASSILLNTKAISRCTGLEKRECVQIHTHRGRKEQFRSLSFLLALGQKTSHEFLKKRKAEFQKPPIQILA